MATNRDLLKEAIADAKTVKDTAIANAKAALEEAFTPYLKEKLAAKINEMDEADDEEIMNEMHDETENMDEMKVEDKNEMDEVSLEELLAELENESKAEDENLSEAKKEESEEEEMSIEDMSEDDLKSFIEDVIKDMVSAGELETGHEGMENEEGAETEKEAEGEEEMEISSEEELDEEINLDELLAEEEVEGEVEVDEAMFGVMGTEEADRRNELYKEFDKLKASGAIGNKDAFVEKAKEDNHAGKLSVQKAKGNNPKFAGKNIIIYTPNPTLMQKLAAGTSAVTSGGGSGEKNAPLEEAYAAIEILKSELNEINLLNAKLLYTNKIFRNKSLTESQKIKVLTAFDKAKNKQEAKLIYETLQESLKVSITKAPIKESLGSASKVLGNASAKPIIEVDNQFARWQHLAGLNKKTNN